MHNRCADFNTMVAVCRMREWRGDVSIGRNSYRDCASRLTDIYVSFWLNSIPFHSCKTLYGWTTMCVRMNIFDDWTNHYQIHSLLHCLVCRLTDVHVWLDFGQRWFVCLKEYIITKCVDDIYFAFIPSLSWVNMDALIVTASTNSLIDCLLGLGCLYVSEGGVMILFISLFYDQFINW